MPFEPGQLLVGGLLGFASAAALRWWQYRRDLWIGEAQRFCDTLEAAADCATEYWLREKLDPDTFADEDDVASKLVDHREILILEAKLLGLQTRLDGLLATFVDQLDHDHAKVIISQLEGLTDALTGGDYGSVARNIDWDRAQLAQVFAGDLIIETRKALNHKLSLPGLLAFTRDQAAKRHIERWRSD